MFGDRGKLIKGWLFPCRCRVLQSLLGVFPPSSSILISRVCLQRTATHELFNEHFRSKSPKNTALHLRFEREAVSTPPWFDMRWLCVHKDMWSACKSSFIIRSCVVYKRLMKSRCGSNNHGFVYESMIHSYSSEEPLFKRLYTETQEGLSVDKRLSMPDKFALCQHTPKGFFTA